MKNEKAKERVHNTVTRGIPPSQVAQSIERLRRVDARDKGRRRSKKRQAKLSTSADVADAFLKCTFQPKLTEDALIKGIDEQKFQSDFYQSLSQLVVKYGVEEETEIGSEFPYNVVKSLCHVLKQLKRRSYGFTDMCLMEHDGDIFFARRKQYDTGRTLYYIPIVPLYKMLKSSEKRKCALLLLSVVSYLYRVADLPYYRQESSYLFDMYNFVGEWQEDAVEDIDPQFLHEERQSKVIGDIMEKKIANSENLKHLKARVDAFKIKDEFDQKCHDIAVRCLDLMRDYPNSRYDSKVDCPEYVDEDGEIIVGFDQIVSFCADNRGIIFNDLFRFVNDQIADYCALEEPTIFIPMDGREIEGNNLDFEERLFALIEDLIFQLDEFRNIK